MAVAQFAREYTAVRRAEGWGSQDSAYYRALPYQDLTGRNKSIWRIRARTYAAFIQYVLVPMERGVRGSDVGRRGDDTLSGEMAASRGDSTRRENAGASRGDAPMERGDALRVLDLGAGNGWLSNRLAERGHSVTAVDLLADPLDGLGAARHYATKFAPLQAEFDHLPVASSQIDLAVFNASLHYSTDYTSTLGETLRVLRPHGTLVILDSPMYVDPTSGARMVQERQARFQTTYGFASNALPSEHFLTRAKLDQLSSQLNLSWTLHQPALDLRSRLSRTVGGLRARREPARFPVIVGRCR